MSRMTVFVGSAMVVSLASLASLTASCSRTSSDDLPEAGPDSEANAPFDAGDFPTYDGAYPMEDATPPDGGPPPVVACDGGTCALPPSVCLDDVWLRAYTTANCDVDAGRCAFEKFDRKCDQFGPPPYCYQGGCRAVFVR